MHPRVLTVTMLAAVLLLPVAHATSQCPASQPNFGPYNRVEILPKGYKLVDEMFTVKAVRVDDDKGESPLSGRSIKVYYLGKSQEQKTLVDSGSTDSRGEYDYTPKELGWYMVECASRAPKFEVKKLYDQPTDFGAVCGNGICETDKLENPSNCPEDCTVCGDGVCEGLEDKENCPDDCIICGDGECDDAEYWPGGCSCVEDCIICGDGICDGAHGENSTVCPEDCGEPAGPKGGEDSSGTYLLIIAIIGVALVLSLFRDRLGDVKTLIPHRKKGKKGGKKKKGVKKSVVEEDEDVLEIILELMETGMSEKRIKGKLKEFGIGSDEAESLIKRAKGLR